MVMRALFRIFQTYSTNTFSHRLVCLVCPSLVLGFHGFVLMIHLKCHHPIISNHSCFCFAFGHRGFLFGQDTLFFFGLPIQCGTNSTQTLTSTRWWLKTTNGWRIHTFIDGFHQILLLFVRWKRKWKCDRRRHFCQSRPSPDQMTVAWKGITFMQGQNVLIIIPIAQIQKNLSFFLG